MDSQVTDHPQNTQSEYFDEYLRVYMEYAEQMVIVHNNHQAFIEHRGLESGEKVRRAMRKMNDINKRLMKLSVKLFQERSALRKAEKQRAKEARAKSPRKLPTNRKGGPDWAGNKKTTK